MYSGSGRVEITAERSIASGDTSNNTYLALPAHSGTHVDAPVHFVDGGASIDQFDAPSWIAERPALIDVPCQPRELIGVDRIQADLDALPRDRHVALADGGPELADVIRGKRPGELRVARSRYRSRSRRLAP